MKFQEKKGGTTIVFSVTNLLCLQDHRFIHKYKKIKKLVFSKLQTKRYRKQVQRTPVESFRCTKILKNTFFIDFLSNQNYENCIFYCAPYMTSSPQESFGPACH